MTLTEFKEYSALYLADNTSKSPHTYDQKRVGVEKFINFMEDEGLEEINTETLLAYRRSLTKYASNTFAQYMNRLNAAFRWMMDMGYTNENPIRARMLNREKYLKNKEILNDIDVMRIFNAVRPGKLHYKQFFRNRAMVILAMTAGMRESEIASVCPRDLDWENNKILIRFAKGGKSRTVPFVVEAQKPVREYMTRFRPKGATDEDPIFLADKKDGGFTPMCRTSVYNSIKKYVETMTGRYDISPHSLRHSFASILVSKGMNVKELQTVLGHARLDTTERYAQLVAPDIQPASNAGEILSGYIQEIRKHV